HIDRKRQLAEGRRLAEAVVATRKACPGRPIYLVGHSTGCAVALAAVESLPPGYVDRVVLLAPSLSVGYDLRPALCSAADGIDVFYSSRDVLLMGFGMRLVGTSDRKWSRAAGRHGFDPVACNAADAALYGKLRQHAWDSCVEWTGYHGGHAGVNKT